MMDERYAETQARGRNVPEPRFHAIFLSPRFWLCLVLLLALALRLYRLDNQSLWYDEGTSVALAQRDVATIITSAAGDIHPPLYYLLLHVWVSLFGHSEIAVRLLSVLIGVVVVGVVYLLAERLFGQAVGLLAAFLAALSPFLVYYSQEVRMYILATLLSTLSVYMLVIAVREGCAWGGRLSWQAVCLWFVYIVITTAALYTHYFAATVVLAQDIAIALAASVSFLSPHAGEIRKGQLPPSPSISLLHGVLPLSIAQIIVVLLYLPWLSVMGRQFSNWPAISEFYNLPTLIGRLFPIFSLGLSVEAGAVIVPLAIFGVVLLVGILPSPPRSFPGRERGDNSPASPVSGRKREIASPLSLVGRGARGEGGFAYLLTLAWLLVPVLAMFVLSLRRPLYNPKFLLVATPAFYLLLGRGLGRLLGFPPVSNSFPPVSNRREVRYVGGGLALATLVVLAASSLFSLRSYYTDPRYARDDYRGVAQSIAAAARAGDAVILNAPGQGDVFGYYDTSSLPVYPLPRQRPLDEEATIGELQQILREHVRLWLVYYGDQQADPHRVIESWLDRSTFKASDRWFGDVRLALYAASAKQPAAMQQLNVRFGSTIQLLGYRLDADQVAAGDIIPLTLFWQTSAPIPERYTVFAHVISPRNTLWGQRDGEPGSGLRPTTTWQTGEIIQDNYGLPILPGTPPGDYHIEIGMYRPESGQRLQITDSSGKPLGDRLLIGPLTIARPAVPPSADVLGMQHRLGTAAASLRLLGYSLGRLGQDPGATEFAGNDALHLTLFWQTAAPQLGDLVLTIKVLDTVGQASVERRTRPVDGDYPTTRWTMQEVVRDQHHIVLAGLKPGLYRLAVEVSDAGGRRLGQIELGRFTVK